MRAFRLAAARYAQDIRQGADMNIRPAHCFKLCFVELKSCSVDKDGEFFAADGVGRHFGKSVSVPFIRKSPAAVPPVFKIKRIGMRYPGGFPNRARC